MITKIYSLNELKHYKYVVVLSRFQGQILLSRHKERTTWETQGGHIEEGETPIEAAKRELYEESGAIQYGIEPLCDYWVGNPDSGLGASGMVFIANIYKLRDIPESEMQEVKTFNKLPDNLTYPQITPLLFEELERSLVRSGIEHEMVIDLHNYVNNGSIFNRTAARGIIYKDGKYLLIHSKYGDHKFPGGGMKTGETIVQTLIREVKEETGYLVNEKSILEGFIVHERRKGYPDDLMIMKSFYFYCEVNENANDRNLDDYEEGYNYQVSWMTLEEAISKNESVQNYENIPWIERETMVMKRLSIVENIFRG